jgi:hypothetical protein
MEATLKDGSWLGPWSGLIHCGRCHALMGGNLCPYCGHALTTQQWTTVIIDGREHKVPAYINQGALSWTAHSLLGLMKREWERPLLSEEPSTAPLAKQCSQRVLVVILFWTLFEHLMDQFFQTALNGMPRGVGVDLLRRHQSIGSRMDRLYTMLFDARIKADLDTLGHGAVYDHLQKIQSRRNDFIHGNAEAIDDGLVRETVERLHDVQAAWVALYNLRCTGDPSAPHVYEDERHREFVRQNERPSPP